MKTQQKDFALVPDDGPPRIIRFVGQGVLPVGWVSTLIVERNLLYVDRARFELLTSTQQEAVYRTHELYLREEQFNAQEPCELTAPLLKAAE
jgi:hypothetical protein